MLEILNLVVQKLFNAIQNLQPKKALWEVAYFNISKLLII